MSKIKFEVVSSNPNDKGGFVTKITNTVSQETAFGTKEKKTTYYVSGSKQLEVDSEVELDMNQWEVKEYPFVPDTTTGEVVQLKWLHLK